MADTKSVRRDWRDWTSATDTVFAEHLLVVYTKEGEGDVMPLVATISLGWCNKLAVDCGESVSWARSERVMGAEGLQHGPDDGLVMALHELEVRRVPQSKHNKAPMRLSRLRVRLALQAPKVSVTHSSTQRPAVLPPWSRTATIAPFSLLWVFFAGFLKSQVSKRIVRTPAVHVGHTAESRREHAYAEPKFPPVVVLLEHEEMY
ncbi:hypothetical protein BDK51DRAFT_31746 [Blyttiomyces helicus]|uniref:Uncharacterized protein n=1 Tax=Blyttiomyces helicus TaxID=388810 RepID=A0A4P9WAG2_9FUNG|nr:hypothetical protein BDK51DRAFT_31746 [Blyttiomyces helicus]|eukprot:RKO89581.1 hypothetical protein BDK51DRAFT_31746 [Blyttiomyces helicus]